MIEKGKWRVGRKLGRTIYAQLGDEPSDVDILIGMMDTEDLAQVAVDAYNKSIASTNEQTIKQENGGW